MLNILLFWRAVIENTKLLPSAYVVCMKVMFSVVSVSLSVHREVSMCPLQTCPNSLVADPPSALKCPPTRDPPPVLFKLVRLGKRTAGLRLKGLHVQFCKHHQ